MVSRMLAQTSWNWCAVEIAIASAVRPGGQRGTWNYTALAGALVSMITGPAWCSVWILPLLII